MRTKEIIECLEGAQEKSGYWIAKCPSHDDKNPSLSIREGEYGSTLIHCHAGCSTEDVMAAIGLQKSDLYLYPEPPRSKRELVATYEYQGADGNLLYEVLRYSNKSFPIRQPDVAGGWKWTSKGIKKVPYRLPEVILAIKEGRPVVVTEGEKDVHTLESLGFVATCCAGGSNGWRSEYGRYFEGADILLCGDTDEPGKQYLINVAKSCTTAKSVKKVELPPLVDDISDWVEHGGNKVIFDSLVDSAPDFDIEFEEQEIETSTTGTPSFSEATDTNHDSRFYSDRDVMKAIPLWGYEDPPPLKWAVDGAIPENYVTILGADGGTGKSFLALDLMFSVATGTPFLGSKVEQSIVLYVDFELEILEQKRRWARILKGKGISQHDETLQEKVFFVKPDAPLSHRSVVDRISEIVKENEVGFVIIDSLTIGLGADATSQDVVTRVMQSLEKLPTILAIDHVTHAVRNANISNASVYGSVMKRNGARSLLMLGKAEGGGLVLRQNKTNFGKEREITCLEIVFDEDPMGPVLVELREITDDVMLGAFANLSTLEITLLGAKELYAESQIPVSAEEIATWREDHEARIGARTIRNHLSDLKRRNLVSNVGTNSWIPVLEDSSRSRSLGAVNSEKSATTGVPVFSEGQLVNTPDGEGYVVEATLSVQQRLPVRLTATDEVKYFKQTDLCQVAR